MKKVGLIAFIVFVAFVIGLILGRGSKATTYQSKASENMQTVSTEASGIKPNLVGIVVSILPMSNGNYSMSINGINQPDFVVSSANKVPLKAKNYLVVVTPKTILTNVSTGKVITIKELQKNAQVAVATGTDLSTALEIAVK